MNDDAALANGVRPPASQFKPVFTGASVFVSAGFAGVEVGFELAGELTTSTWFSFRRPLNTRARISANSSNFS